MYSSISLSNFTAGRKTHLDIGALELSIQGYFVQGLAKSTMTSYTSARRSYFDFCTKFSLSAVPFSERQAFLFAAYLVDRGSRPQTISAYLAGVRHFLVVTGSPVHSRMNWPRLPYVLRGIKRLSAPLPKKRWLPITISILKSLHQVLESFPDRFTRTMLWCACCLGFFGFMRCGEFLVTHGNSNSPAVLVSDFSIDSHTAPSVVRVFLGVAKCDPFGKGVFIYLGRSGTLTCPVAAMINYLTLRPSNIKGPLLIWQDGSPLSRDYFVRCVKDILSKLGFDSEAYSGHSFRIGAATTAAMAGIQDHTIKMLGGWQSDAYR